MRKIWIKIDPWDKELVTTALEGGADGVLPMYLQTEPIEDIFLL